MPNKSKYDYSRNIQVCGNPYMYVDMVTKYPSLW
jgi:hypothetical protein